MNIKNIVFTFVLCSAVGCQYFTSTDEKNSTTVPDTVLTTAADTLKETVQDSLYDGTYEDDCCDEEIPFFIILDEERSADDIARENTLKGDVKELTTVYLDPLNGEDKNLFTTKKTETVLYKHKNRQQTLVATNDKRVKTIYKYNNKQLLIQERIFIENDNPTSNHISYDTLRYDYTYQYTYNEDDDEQKWVSKEGIHDVMPPDWDIYLNENKYYENDLIQSESYEKKNSDGYADMTKERKEYVYVFYPDKKIKKKRVILRVNPDEERERKYVEYFIYNPKGQLIAYKEVRNGTYYEEVDDDFEDKEGDIIQTHNYTYNSAGLRATKTVDSPYEMEYYNGKYTYKYDSHKNLVGVALYNAKDSLLSKSTCAFKYDKQGNWTQKIVYDASGNPYSAVLRFITYTKSELNQKQNIPIINEQWTMVND